MPLAQLAALLRDITCYELMPTHGKLVTLDADLPMKHALSAMAQHNITCLPVWDSMQQRLVDVFTCSDLVDVVLFTHRALSVAQGAAGTSQAPAAGAAQEQIDACQLRDLHGLKRSKAAGFEMASVDDSLYNACVLLHRHGLECLPLGETAASTSLLHVLLPEQLLAYIASSPDLQDSAPEIFGATIEQAVLPRCAEPAAVRATAPLSDALLLLAERRLAAVAVLDDAGQLRDVLSRADVRHFAENALTDNLTTAVGEALLTLPRPAAERLHTCSPADSLASAVHRLAAAEATQLVCVAAGGAIVGLITSSDILTTFLDVPAAPTPTPVLAPAAMPVPERQEMNIE